MNFIQQTRLVKTNDGTQTDSKPIRPTTVATLTGVFTNVRTALAQANISTTSDKYGAYELQYNLAVYYVIERKGVIDQGDKLYLIVRFWPDKASYDNGDKPSLIEDWKIQFRPRLGLILADQIHNLIQQYLVKASLQNLSGNRTDNRPIVNNLVDPHGLLLESSIAILDRTAKNLTVGVPII